MAFSRVHYKAIARIIANASAQVTRYNGDYATGSTQTLDKAELVSELSKLFVRDNERFDEGRFIDACYQS